MHIAKMKTSLVAMSIAAFTVAAACSKTPAPSAMDHSGMGGMKHMEGMSMTGDADIDFAANMRMHHQMALPMAQAELNNGKDPQMQKMAKDIIVAQTKEIVVFDQWLTEHKSSAPMVKDK